MDTQHFESATTVETVLVLRTCDADMRSHGGFLWPQVGPVECADWEPTKRCGNGLHGLLWGEGNGFLLNWDSDAKWLVVEVEAQLIVDLDGKVKFPRGTVIYCGDRVSAAKRICEDPRAAGKQVIAGTATAGDSGTATAGNYGTATAGFRGTATAGNYGTATAGDSGTATAGDSGTATAGDSGTATAGNYGTATAGFRGTATAGNYGTATAGDSGTATAGENGCLCIHWYDAKRGIYKIRATDVDGEKIKPGIAYRLNESGEFVEAQP